MFYLLTKHSMELLQSMLNTSRATLDKVQQQTEYLLAR